MIFEILVGMAIGAIIGAVLWGLTEVLSGAKQVLERNKSSNTTYFMPREEMIRFTKGKPGLKKIHDSLTNQNIKASYLVLEDGCVVGCEHVTAELKEEVSLRGYTYSRGDSQLTIRV